MSDIFETAKLQALIDAIVAYDEGAQERADAMEALHTNEDVRAWQESVRAALEPVQDAFHDLTSAFNSLSACRCATIGFMRRCAERFCEEGVDHD